MKIALMGYSRSGKDTVTEIIHQLLTGHTIDIAFADKMKDLFHDVFKDVPRNPKPRMGYEKFGQTMREIDENVWIKQVERVVRQYVELNFHNIIITDVRQPNEAQWAKDNGFTLIRVWARDYIRQERAAGDREFKVVSPSEELMWTIEADYNIPNNGTREVLEINVRRVLEQLVEKELLSR